MCIFSDLLVYSYVDISTHAPRTGSDPQISQMQTSRCYFNPRSPHGERQNRVLYAYIAVTISTHAPRTGSDQAGHARNGGKQYFNPRSPHGERRCRRHTKKRATSAFQPTLPARGATADGHGCRRHTKISTHAPRTGSDSYEKGLRDGIHISTHAPRTGSDRRCLRG